MTCEKDEKKSTRPTDVMGSLLEPKTLRERLIMAIIEALAENDPIVIVGVGDGELKLSWPGGKDEVDLDFDAWLQQGYQAGWVGPPVCDIHDGTPTSEAEDNDLMDGGEPCIHVLRLYQDRAEKQAVEANHAPSQWRASNRGLHFTL